MKTIKRKVQLLSLVMLLYTTISRAAEPTGQVMKPVPFAIIELFTSEGCSSCPPADKLLAKLSADQVTVLSFHVDYWDRLGWKDPHSSTWATQRQNDYAKRFKSDQVYTPQMIVNGTSEFVGSNASRATTEVATALKQVEKARLSLELGKREALDQPLKYQASEFGAGTVLNLALVEKQFTSEVPRGENAGKTLVHTNSVLGFRTLDFAKSSKGELKISLPEKVPASELFVFGYLQIPETGQIIAVCRAEIKE
jgi:hypothetical protein